MSRLDEFEILNKRLIQKTKIFDLYLEDIKTPSNKIVEWVHLDHKGASVILPIDNDGKIILIRQYRNNAEGTIYEVPAGGLEKGESPLDCAIRELEEEIGKKSNNITKLFSIYSSIGFSNEKLHFYIATDLFDGNQNLDEDEYIEICKFTVEEVLQMIYTGEVVDSKVVIAVLAYINLKNK